MVATVQAADQCPLEDEPERGGKRYPERYRQPQAAGQRRQREREISPDHVEAAMGEIDHAHDAEDQRQSARDQKQEQAVLDAIENLDQPFHGTDLSLLRRHRVGASTKTKRGRSPPPRRTAAKA